MAVELVDLSETEFVSRLEASAGAARDCDRAALSRMYLHYRELRRWNRRVALVGKAMAERGVERLFGESLAALDRIDASVREVLDVGSGAGFPGLVIAAARPDLRVTLVEPRTRKWAFLRKAAEAASLSCVCLNARVAAALPSGVPERVDRVTVRALHLGSVEMAALAGRLSERGSFLVWSSDGSVPEGYERIAKIELPAERGSILEMRPRQAETS